MDIFAEPARELVEQMCLAAEDDSARAISFQGAPGANSHRAVMEWAPESLPLPCFSFADAIEAVKSGKAGCAMIPIENSQAGRVADIHFLLPESGLSIVGEHFLAIHHDLMAVPHKDGSTGPFKGAYSHTHALGQSRKFLRDRGIVPLSHADTAGAAAYVAELGDPTIAAISPTLAADLYGLTIVEKNVEDADDNTTRFVVLAPEPLDCAELSGEAVMTTFVFQVNNVPAALYKALGCFATNGVNMTKLESYQQGSSFAATKFYVDIVGAPGEPSVDRALEELNFHSKSIQMLGSYRQARKRG